LRFEFPHIAALVLAFILTLVVRVRGVTEHFYLLGDQIRDWGIALRPFSDLPLVGPPTHVRGYTIGPAFYWILWAIRVTLGPWFDNLPHAGGIGQAVLQSVADTFLLFAVWRRTQSVWAALAVIVLVATASFDLALSALVWNPVMGSTLAKIATACVFLDWHRRSTRHAVLTAVAAWGAVHAYTGAAFVTLGVFVTALLDPLVRGERALVRRNLLVLAAVVVLLQLPYLVHQMRTGFRESAMGAVTGSIGRIATGSAPPQLATSVAGYVHALDVIQVAPVTVAFTPLVVVLCGVIVSVRYRRDTVVLMTVLLPQVAAIVGYGLFLGALDAYYYLSLMPAAVLTVVLAAPPVPSAPSSGQIPQLGAIALLAAAVAIVPMRLRHATVFFRLPVYQALIDGSRRIATLRQPMRAIRTEFALPPTGDPEFAYLILGGRLDRQSPWIGVITPTGEVKYRRIESAERQ